jgi:hypothetical protein
MKKGISLYLLSSSVSIILSSNAFAGFSASEDYDLVGCIPAEWGTYYCNPTVIGETSTEKPEYSPTVQETTNPNEVIGIGSPIANYGLVESPEFPAATGIGISSMSSYDQSDIMANALAGSGITSVISSSYTGALNASGVFINGTSSVGFEEGIILTTGDAEYAIGPNQYSYGIYTDNNTAGNVELDEILSTKQHLTEVVLDDSYFGTFNDGLVDFSNPIKPIPDPELFNLKSTDAATLDINFIPEGDQVTLNYVFATETNAFYASLDSSYNEYAPYDNDVLGIFINGENYARLPNGEDATIYNLLYTDNNASWVIDNSDGTKSNIEYDFLTSTLSLTASVNSGVLNTLSISIADGYVEEMGDFTKSDDSAVFIDGALTSTLSEGATAGSTQLNALMPDEVDPETGGFSFTFDKPEDMIFIDPEVAVGYVYEVTSQHEFASVLLPLIGDGEFLLQIYNEATGEFEGNYVLDYGVEYFFDDYTTEEVTLFQILGIEVEEEIDPTDVTAFITGLTFNTLPGATNPSLVTMSQTPITQMIGGNTTPSEVPVPATLALFGLGLVIIARRRKAA